MRGPAAFDGGRWSTCSAASCPCVPSSFSGARLQACSAVTPHSIGELVKEGVNGRLFETAGQLARHMQSLLRDLSGADAILKQYAANLRGYVAPENQWEASWTAIAQPLFT